MKRREVSCFKRNRGVMEFWFRRREQQEGRETNNMKSIAYDFVVGLGHVQS